MKKILLGLFATGAITFGAVAQNMVTIDFDKVIKVDVKKGAASANLCWLLDSDQKRPNEHRSMESALTDVGVGALRFPYGHLADNYLWHTPPYDDVKGGLRPSVAVKTRPPGKWSWGVNSDGTFKDAMDFDEFMALCQRNGIKPLVVVNLLSHKYNGGPTIEELATNAAEWVRYAKKKNYDVAYWQIGNEIDHHPKTITLQEFIDGYKVIASAMKEVNPDANIGPGILGKHSFFTGLYNVAPELVDFTSCHQYMWRSAKTCKTYDLWSKSNEVYIPNVLLMQRAVNQSDNKDMEILITETGVSPSGQGMGDINNTYKALWWFEVLMSELKVPNVAYSFFWGTHSPWKGMIDDEKDDVAIMFRMDDNSSKPTAEISKIVNANLKEQFVGCGTNSDALRVFSMVDKDKKEGVVFVMNKLKTKIPITLKLNNLPDNVKELEVATLSGDGPFARTMEYKKGENIKIDSNSVKTELLPLSISVFTYKIKK